MLMCMNVSVQYLISVGTDMSVIFENQYTYEHNSTCLKLTPLPSLPLRAMIVYDSRFKKWNDMDLKKGANK